jgi:hypothetical protein
MFASGPSRKSTISDLISAFAGDAVYGHRLNYRLRRRANQWFLFARPVADQEGRFAIVTNVGHGMRWTRWRRKTGDANADGEVVWS